jgi:hypothetical protein
VHFTDVAQKAGLTAPVIFGGENTKKYIIETTGTGVAIFDYDNDGWPDIFIVNGTTLEASATGKGPVSHLYHNNHDGTFADVTAKSGLTHTGWGQGVCVGDYDNDGFEDLYVTYYGKNVLYHNNGNGTFTEVGEKAHVAGSGKAWGTGCAFVDYDRDGKLDLVVANYVDYDSATALAPGERPACMWKGIPVMCGPRGLPWAKNILYHNLGNGTFEDVTAKAHIDQTNGHYSFSVSTLDYDDDGWPDIFVACDGHPKPSGRSAPAPGTSVAGRFPVATPITIARRHFRTGSTRNRGVWHGELRPPRSRSGRVPRLCGVRVPSSCSSIYPRRMRPKPQFPGRAPLSGREVVLRAPLTEEMRASDTMSPDVVTPPDAMPINDCHTWNPASCLCLARSRNASQRSRR